jgi:hypothetical protein
LQADRFHEFDDVQGAMHTEVVGANDSKEKEATATTVTSVNKAQQRIIAQHWLAERSEGGAAELFS